MEPVRTADASESQLKMFRRALHNQLGQRLYQSLPDFANRRKFFTGKNRSLDRHGRLRVVWLVASVGDAV
jgi:hypothetical protein